MTPEETIEWCNKIDDDCVGLDPWEIGFVGSLRDGMYRQMYRYGDRAKGPTALQIEKLKKIYRDRLP